MNKSKVIDIPALVSCKWGNIEQKKFKMTYILNFSAEIPHSKINSQIRGIYKKPTPSYIINTDFSNEISS